MLSCKVHREKKERTCMLLLGKAVELEFVIAKNISRTDPQAQHWPRCYLIYGGSVAVVSFMADLELSWPED